MFALARLLSNNIICAIYIGLDIAALWRSAAVTRGNIFNWFSGLRGYYAGVQLGIPILMLLA